jgi:Tfp pilus assembly protein PilF
MPNTIAELFKIAVQRSRPSAGGLQGWARRFGLSLILVGLAWQPCAFAQDVVLLNFSGQVEFMDAGATRWNKVFETNRVFHVGDRGRTGPNSRATLQLSDLSILRLGERSEFLVEPNAPKTDCVVMSLLRGLAWVFHRDKPGSVTFRKGTTAAATRGTEFVIESSENGRMSLTVLEGEAELSNPQGTLTLAPNEQGISEPGQKPQRAAVIEIPTLMQWFLYYPGILHLGDLEWSPSDLPELRTSLQAYQNGDFLKALEEYPAARVPQSISESLYYASLLLAVGNVHEAQKYLGSVPADSGRRAEVSRALEVLIGIVKGASDGLDKDPPQSVAPSSATLWMAESYRQQARGDILNALMAARSAVKEAPEFALGWIRVGELEFSRGNVAAARSALEQGIHRAPRHAQAMALRGFIAAAEMRFTEAERLFQSAIHLDGGLADAWLGRGLCRMHEGRLHEGRVDLQVAAALEPRRAALRSYLAKAWSQSGDKVHAHLELQVAQLLDQADPTAWFYQALLLQKENRFNESVLSLEHSQRLNDNRQIYRSRLLLDQDRSVRGANLATLYQGAGLTDVAVREAARSVSADYANHSSHLFLANAYNQLRDPNQIDLRYESAWLSEYLLAQLLAPPSSGTMSQPVSHQEYTRLFEQRGFGFSSGTEYSSQGDWSQSALHSGSLDRSAYAVESTYRNRNGMRPNNDFEQTAVEARVKQQISTQTSVYVQAGYSEGSGGDLAPYYDGNAYNPGFRSRETQEPLILAGLHHEWHPGSHTLILAGRLQDTLRVTDPFQSSFYFGSGGSVRPLLMSEEYQSELQLATAELQQIWQTSRQTLVLGGRVQTGGVGVEAHERQARILGGPSVPFQSDQSSDLSFQRVSVYGYEQWQVLPSLQLVAGLSYDRMTAPVNFRQAPIAVGGDSMDQVSPKLGFVWTPDDRTAVRAGVARALTGMSLDQSFQLEPTQVAGINQAYRGLIPEALTGAVALQDQRLWGLSVERKLGPRTTVAITGDWMESGAQRSIGAVRFSPPFTFSAHQTPETLGFRERSVAASAHHLLGEEVSLGLKYRFSEATLDQEFPDLAAATLLDPGLEPALSQRAKLHQTSLWIGWSHPAGWFAQGEQLWWKQDLDGDLDSLKGDSVWQWNL